jgi:hypothetical protein
MLRFHMTDAARRACARALAVVLLGTTCLGATAQPPQRNLLVQLRWVDAANDPASTADEGTPTTASRDITVGTRSVERVRQVPHEVSVLNGQWAVLRWSESVAVQWLRSAVALPAMPGASGTGKGPGQGAGPPAGGFEQAVTWLERGQGLAVRPRWPGGSQPVALDLRTGSATVDESPGSALPGRAGQAVGTTVLVALGRWTTCAVVGGATPAQTGRQWSTTSIGSERPLHLQVRVQAP